MMGLVWGSRNSDIKTNTGTFKEEYRVFDIIQLYFTIKNIKNKGGANNVFKVEEDTHVTEK